MCDAGACERLSPSWTVIGDGRKFMGPLRIPVTQPEAKRMLFMSNMIFSARFFATRHSASDVVTEQEAGPSRVPGPAAPKEANGKA